MKAKELKVFEMCIERAIEYGWNRAHKHVENPQGGVIKDAIYVAILSEIHDYFTFPELYHDDD